MILVGQQIGMRFGSRWLYQNVDFSLKKGEILAITGENGIGKTTLLRAILGQMDLSAGALAWPNGPQKMAYVPQFRPEVAQFGLTIRDFVALSFYRGWSPFLTRAEKAALQAVLAQTHLQEIADRGMDTASGGERQRAYLAQALLQQPDVLILDEATANLDPQAKIALMDAVVSTGLSVLMVSHDEGLVAKYAHGVLHLRGEGSEFSHV